MPIRNTGNLRDQLRRLQAVGKRLPRFVGALAVAHFKEGFKNQGFTDDSLEKWTPRKKPDTGRAGRRAILVKTGALRRSIRIVSMSSARVIVGSNLPYAQIHNEGGRINATQQVAAHRRRAHIRRVDGKRQRVSEHTVSAHSRKVNTLIPQRRFIGRSRVLNQKIEGKLIQELRNILNP